MRRDEGRAGLEPAMNFTGGARALRDIQEMQRQKAGGRIERSFGRIVDVVFAQRRAFGVRPWASIAASALDAFNEPFDGAVRRWRARR